MEATTKANIERSKLIPIVGFILAIGLAFGLGIYTEHMVYKPTTKVTAATNALSPFSAGGRQGVSGRRAYGGYGGFAGGGASTTRLSGVVTQVNGTNFVVAGEGTTSIVDTTSSTQYSGATTVAVNDSVLVEGTDTSGTWAATTVIVNPGSGGGTVPTQSN